MSAPGHSAEQGLVFTSPKVQRLRRLTGRRSARTDDGSFVVEGASLIRQAADAGWDIEAQFVAPGGTPVEVSGAVFALAEGVLERVATTESPQPLLAIVRQRDLPVPSDVDFVVVGDRIADPGNAGTIIRSAEAAGADAVVFTEGSVDPYNPKVVRATAGSLFRIPVLTRSLAEVAALGVQLVATSSHRGEAYTDTDLTAPIAVVLGNEAHGVPDDAPVHRWITIPHHGGAESLNVAMAATVLAFEVARQRRGRR